MSILNRPEPFPECNRPGDGHDARVYIGKERRHRRRTELHWKLQVYVAGRAAPVHTRTENLSSCGFYCHVPEALAAGQAVDCVLELPSHGDERESRIYLNCRATVIRIERGQRCQAFGIGCRIDEYSVFIATDGLGRCQSTD